jgi:serine/threonine protein kinase/Tol biopolymer transport system component
MDAARLKQVEDLLLAALECAPHERSGFLQQACAGDESLEREVRSLLASHDAAGFFETPALDMIARRLAREPEPDRRLTGLVVSHYRILDKLGSGGMGEVYRARDTKLGRDVAIKVLPPIFTTNPERLARFEREARVLASLNHVNIGAIYGVEDSEGVQALVLELVEGPTLAERLTSGPLPIKEALVIAWHVTEALEAAHERGIIHRDLKPPNIKFTREGVVKVLDFGLAKTVVGDTPGPDLTQAPAVTVLATREGTLLGTAAYMSPEQARGQAVDKQTDIWAFGCVLYELLTGRAAFARGTITDTLAAIVERDPAWDALPSSTPHVVVRLVRRCLEKDPRRRLHDISDARIEIEEALQAPEQQTATKTSHVAPVRLPRRALVATAIVAVAVGVVATGLYVRRAADVVPSTRLSISAPGVITPQLSAAISPNGRRVAFVSTDLSGRSMLWIRELDSLEPRALAGTEDAAHPFWSPDGVSLGFLAGGKLKRVDAGGGRVLTLADVGGFRSGGSWSRNGTILFTPRLGELATVPAAGGPVSTVLTRGEAIWPFFLPDGRHFLFVDRSGPEATRGVHVGSLDAKEATHLLASDFKAAYSDPGYLLFVRGESILAQPFDTQHLRLTGEPAVVADRIWVARSAAQASFSVSQTGVLAYVNAALWNLQLSWIDRAGTSLGTVGPPDRYFDEVPQISPDGSRVAIARGPFESEDVWVLNIAAGTEARLTFDPGGDSEPIWSSDARTILFQSHRAAKGLGLYLKDAGGAGSEDAVDVIARESHLWDWSRDGRFIVYSAIGVQHAADLWVLPRMGDRKPFPFAESPFHKTQAQISPNGRWLAYTSYESGKDEVYVQSFPAPGSRRQVSLAGGVQPRWRRDGAELFYLGSDQTLMAVPVTATEGAFEVGRPRPLFRTRIIPQGSQSLWFDTMYDVTPDGQRFLVLGPPDETVPPITVVLNWLGALKK